MPSYGSAEVVRAPGLATVTIDTRPNDDPVVQIVLDPKHDGTVDAYSVDIDDFLGPGWEPGGVYFQGSDADSVNDPKLIKFLELCSLWDDNFDGVYDADELIEKVLGALRNCDAETKPFHRPNSGIYTRQLMRLMPPEPERHIIFSYEDLKPRFRLRHYLMVVPAIAVVVGVISLEIHWLPFMGYSVISGFWAAVDRYGYILPTSVVLAYILVNRRFGNLHDNKRSLSPHTYGFFSKAAVLEEQAFREGAEHWSWSQRVTSCMVFGAVHMVNLFYPLATIVPLAMGGGLFMAVYLRIYKRTRRRRNAVLEASVTHRVYNRLALSLTALVLLGLLGSWLVTLVSSLATLMVTWGSMAYSNSRNDNGYRAVATTTRSSVVSA